MSPDERVACGQARRRTAGARRDQRHAERRTAKDPADEAVQFFSIVNLYTWF